jgi:hypothetical protein
MSFSSGTSCEGSLFAGFAALDADMSSTHHSATDLGIRRSSSDFYWGIYIQHRGWRDLHPTPSAIWGAFDQYFGL